MVEEIMPKPHLRLVKNTKHSKIIRRKIITTINRALKDAQDCEWQDIIIMGVGKDDYSLFHSRMVDNELIALFERAKNYILTTDSIE